MKKYAINPDGACVEQWVKRLRKKIGNEATEKLRQTAVDIVQKCVDVYSETLREGDVGANGTGRVGTLYQGGEPIPTGTTGLIYGRVQSGKTNATIATLAIAHANHFRCFIVLTSNNRRSIIN